MENVIITSAAILATLGLIASQIRALKPVPVKIKK